MNVLEDVTKTTVKLLIKEPFYGHFFTHIHKSLSDKEERVCLTLLKDGRLFLLINPKYWQALTTDQKFGCIKHQILHLVFRHIYVSSSFGDKKLFNLASDLVVNQFLKKEQQSTDALTLEDFPFIKLNKGEFVGYYYTKIKRSSASERYSKEGKDNPSKGEQSGNANTAGDPLSEHSQWKNFDTQSGAQRKFVEEKLDTYTHQSAERLNTQNIGLLPLGLQTQIQEAQQRLKPAVHWKRLLRLYIQSSRKTYVKSTMQRPSRRYGTIPGTKIKQRQKVLIAIDTSGSVDKEELSVFFAEIYHIWRQSAEIEIVECDAKIQRQYRYKGHTPQLAEGGGGTSLNPPIELANTLRPDVLIYFTDGYASVPSIVSNSPIIWVITAAGIQADKWSFLLGRKVKLQ